MASGGFRVGLTYQFASFETLQGADLTAGTFPTNAARFVNQVQPFSVDTLSLTLDVKTVTGIRKLRRDRSARCWCRRSHHQLALLG